ncbi:hypothetical protein T265_07230 [Opisthorchis viverrini]|uniref:Uncharacterized protein n=1 Tax=Opisthorchis viverrini TaxID=6198 RepID=A0A074ZPP7_OPIVI|nr:hypothetical protein T265_07230 [Opisthorchis viverrini]KER25295.1 hypothetical protein T265_07230 [Opisthorchis viverrini]
MQVMRIDMIFSPVSDSITKTHSSTVSAQKAQAAECAAPGRLMSQSLRYSRYRDTYICTFCNALLIRLLIFDVLHLDACSFSVLLTQQTDLSEWYSTFTQTPLICTSIYSTSRFHNKHSIV